MQIYIFCFPDNCPMAGYIVNLEEASRVSTLLIFFSILLIVLVGLDKQIVFRKVYGMEHMLRMKKFSTSDIHFKMSIFIPITVIAFGTAVFKTVYTQVSENKDSVSNHPVDSSAFFDCRFPLE